MADPASTVAAILRHIESAWIRSAEPPRPGRTWRENGLLVARLEGTDADGVTLVCVATQGHAWRLQTFAAARRLKVEVRVDPEMWREE